MRITSKGQVTIPQALREKTGLLPHTEVEFELIGKAVTLRPARKSVKKNWPEFIKRMRGRGEFQNDHR